MSGKRKLLIGLSIFSLFPLGVLFVVVTAVVGLMANYNAVMNVCAPLSTGPGTAPAGLGTIAGPTGGPVQGKVILAQANIPNRTPAAQFADSMAKVVSTRPDFVTLNEVSGRTLQQIEAAAPGYTAYRDPVADPGPGGAAQSMGNVVLWKSADWAMRNSGRVKLVDDDTTFYEGRPVIWDRYATWALLQRKSDKAVVSVVAAHMPTNPAKFPRQHGTPTQTRTEQYGAGMDILLQLRTSLADHGPVLVAGDMNTHASDVDQPWSAAAKMQAAGYAWYAQGLDFVFYPETLGARLEQGWSGPMASDHRWVATRINMNGAGTATSAGTADVLAPTEAPTSTSSSAAPAVAGGDVVTRLQQLRFAANYPKLTAEQARNAVAIATVARELGVTRHGLEIAIGTAIQESKLINLDGGDLDSGGLFQQRPSAGWGTRAQITNPTLATRAFFGQAQHTNNPGLLDIPSWQQMTIGEAVKAFQNPTAGPAALADYDQWDSAAASIAAVLGGDLPASTESACPNDGTSPLTVATLNLLGAGHTAPGGDRMGFETWDKRLPGAMAAIENSGATVAGLQEVHAAQSKGLAERYAGKWSIYPAGEQAQNKVIWDRNSWRQTAAELVPIPYFQGHETGMPLVQLTGVSGSLFEGQSIWVWNVHNPADVAGAAERFRSEGLRRELDRLSELAESGAQAIILGDFNDAQDGNQSSHCVLTPTLTNAFPGGTASPCKKPPGDSNVDHIYGANLTWTSARVDTSTKTGKVSDHPLVVATTAGGNLSMSESSIVELASRIAWPVGKEKTMTPFPAFVEAKQQAMKAGGTDYMPTLYASCDRFVATVVKLTVDPQMPWGDSTAQHTYLMNSPKWTQRRGPVQPGDILSAAAGAGRGHILIYLGGGRAAQASYMSYTGRISVESVAASSSGNYHPGGDSRTFHAFYFTGAGTAA